MSKSKFSLFFNVGIAMSAIVCCAFLPAVSHAAAQDAASQTKKPKAVAAYVPQKDYVYDIGAKRDPFIPLITSDGRFVQLERSQEELDASVLKLEGIIYDKYGLSYAIVDGSVVKVGDIVADYQVLKVDENKVSFIREGQIKEVFLQKED
jgi:hypothetical protein